MKSSYAFLLLTFLCLQGLAQSPTLEGDWEGAIEIPGTPLAFMTHFEKSSGQWKGTIDIPMQQLKAGALSEVKVEGSTVSFAFPAAPGNARFSGEIQPDGKAVSGQFSQGGQGIPFKMHKSDAAQKAAAELPAKVKAFEAFLDSVYRQQHVVGMAVAVVKDDKVVMQRGFGERELGKGQPVDENTLFPIGSSSKAFTAALLAMLVDDGKLAWDKPVRTYLPDFKLHDEFATAEMTPLDLLCHRSGLPRHDMVWYGSNATREELYHRLPYLLPNKSFRSAWQYQNLMYLTAGYLAERITGSTWEDLVRKRILSPLGMNSSGFSIADLAHSPNAAKGYRWDEKAKQQVALPYRNIDAVGPAGSINSNLKDMAAWVQLQLGKGKFHDQQLVSSPQMTLMHQPHMSLGVPAKYAEVSETHYGLGWMLYHYKGHKVVEHGGNIDGFSSEVFLLPNDGLGFVILTNMDGSNLRKTLCLQGSDIFLGLDPTDWYGRTFNGGRAPADVEGPKPPKPSPVPGTRASHPLADYVGEYSHPGYGVLSIQMEGKALKALYNGITFELSHFHYDVFQAVNQLYESEYLITFFTGKAGDVMRLEAPLEPTVADIAFEKLPPAQLTQPDFLKLLVGKFSILDGKMEINVALVQGNMLEATVKGQPPYLLYPWRNTEFKLGELNGYSIEFVAGKSGHYDAVVVHQPDIVIDGKRVEAGK